jgi:choline dehydrogenase-like flavoprotein
VSAFPDPFTAGLQRGWKVLDGAIDDVPADLIADVAIVGTGAGGGITAEILAKAGLDVLMIEEGPLVSSSGFTMREAHAYSTLYQESAARKTLDKAINIMQGRCVGGSTTVNWTGSFRTPVQTLSFWRDRFALPGFTAEDLAPWFEQAERRLSIGPWTAPPNANNDVLRRGAVRLGIEVAPVDRNVRGCFNLGYCGMGCPTNAKQSMLVTTIPAALDGGARLLTRARAQRLIVRGGSIRQLEVTLMDAAGLAPRGRTVRVAARHFVLAGGAINTPALLLRSGTPDPRRLAGRRTFLHPTVISIADMEEPVRGFEGAPLAVYSDHYLDAQPIDGPIGFKLETPPLHPVLFASSLPGFGPEHARAMKRFAHTQALIALMRDGFHDESPGGTVRLRDDTTPVLDYPLNEFLFDGARRAFHAMAEVQFAAGARSVRPGHERAQPYPTLAAARAAIDALPMRAFDTKVVSAHVMGGCPFSADERRGLVRTDGQHHHVQNLSVHDGSLFPTSLGANPQLSVYAVTARLASGLAQRLTGRRDVRLAG